MPQKISKTVATQWINHYLNNTTVPPGVRKTESVLFDFPELSEAIRAGFPPDGSTNPSNTDYGFICHFARYQNSGDVQLEDRNLVVIEFVKKEAGEWIPISNQVWDFGDLKPPKL